MAEPKPKNETRRGARGTSGAAQAAKVEVCAVRETVTLAKGSHRWTFSCARGDEKTLLMRLAELARQEDVPFDWFDAALVSHQLRNRLLPGLARTDGAPGSATTG